MASLVHREGGGTNGPVALCSAELKPREVCIELGTWKEEGRENKNFKPNLCTEIILFKRKWICHFIIPILQMGKLRLKEF